MQHCSILTANYALDIRQSALSHQNDHIFYGIYGPSSLASIEAIYQNDDPITECMSMMSYWVMKN